MALNVLAVGDTVQRGGYFTKRKVLGNLADARELERRLGYAPGRLTSGWYVLFMIVRPPRPDEFELGGYTHFSGSRERGHTDTPGASAEEWLRTHRIDVGRHREAAASAFAIDGPERLTKIVPVVGDGIYWHPDPDPVPQWRLCDGKTMTFLVAEQHRG